MGTTRSELFRTGNRVLLFGDGEGKRQLLGEGFVGRMAEATDARLNVQTGARAVYVVGDAEPQDIVDGPHAYDVRLSMVMLTTTKSRNIIEAGPINIDVIDRFTNDKIASAEKCHLQGGGMNIPANQLMARDLSFTCMRIT